MNKILLFLITFTLPYYSLGQDESDDNKIYITTEIQAEYPGGFKELISFIGNNLRIPQELIRMNISCGRVLISVVVEKDGSLTDIKIEKGCHHLYDAEMIKVLTKTPKWQPAIHQKKTVRSKFTFSIITCFE